MPSTHLMLKEEVFITVYGQFLQFTDVRIFNQVHNVLHKERKQQVYPKYVLSK